MSGNTMKEACEIRETFWQGVLKSTQLFGGMNKLIITSSALAGYPHLTFF